MANWNVFLPQRDTDEEVREFLHNNLHFQGKVRVVGIKVFCGRKP